MTVSLNELREDVLRGTAYAIRAALAQDATPTEEEPVDRSPDAQLWPATAPLESAWVLIANAYDGNWEQAPVEWREAAEKWRDEVWHKSLATPTEECPHCDKGAITVAAHHPGCNGSCDLCPIPVQEPCLTCGGTGRLATPFSAPPPTEEATT